MPFSWGLIMQVLLQRSQNAGGFFLALKESQLLGVLEEKRVNAALEECRVLEALEERRILGLRPAGSAGPGHLGPGLSGAGPNLLVLLLRLGSWALGLQLLLLHGQAWALRPQACSYCYCCYRDWPGL